MARVPGWGGAMRCDAEEGGWRELFGGSDLELLEENGVWKKLAVVVLLVTRR
jgi:hypothetical protein